MTNEIVKTASSPMAMMKIAMEGGADLGQLEKMLTLQERWDANEAKKAYHLAMAEFKKKPPLINKDKTVAYSGTRYTHASLGNVAEKINSALGEHGLTASWKTTQENTIITVTCSITHKMGHSELTALSSPPDNSGKKNSIQAMGSAISYLSRYTLLSLTGLATCDQDDDAQAAAVILVDDKQQNQIVDMMTAASVDQDHFLKYLKYESVKKIPASMFNRVMNDLKVVLAKKEGEK